MASLADREISSANRPETLLDATAGLCQAERRATNRAALATDKSSIPITRDRSHEALMARCIPQGNIELVPEKEVLDFKLAPRLEQVGDKRPKQNRGG